MGRALSRIAHEILERNRGAPETCCWSAYSDAAFPWPTGFPSRLHEFEGVSDVPVGSLDINLYRDDLRERKRPRVRVHRTDLPVSIQGQRIVLVDDVLYTGRTIRAALDALNDYGRPDSGAAGGDDRPRPPRAAHSGPTTSAATFPLPGRKSSPFAWTKWTAWTKLCC